VESHTFVPLIETKVRLTEIRLGACAWFKAREKDGWSMTVAGWVNLERVH